MNPEQIAAEARAQRIFETHAYLADLVRVERIGYALLKAASPYCIKNRKYTLGIPPTSSNDLPETLRTGFGEALGPDAAHPRFLLVARDSPTWKAGVHDNDQLLSIMDSATGKSVRPGWVFNRPANTLATNASFKLEVGSAHEKHVLEVKPQLMCEEIPRLIRQDALVARVHANSMVVSTGLLRFVNNDDELALLLANELAHSILPYSAHGVEKTSAQTSPRHSPALAAYSTTEERYADYLGTYIAVIAGFDADHAKDIWLRVAGNPPSRTGKGIAHVHPFSAQRALWQRATLAEIHRKSLTGLQLVPDRKSLPPDLHTEFAAADDPFAQPVQ